MSYNPHDLIDLIKDDAITNPNGELIAHALLDAAIEIIVSKGHSGYFELREVADKIEQQDSETRH